MSVSYTLNGHYLWRIGDDLNIPLITVQAVIERYLQQELLAAGVKEYTVSVVHHGGGRPVLRDLAETAPPECNPPAVAEIAERLAKVEARLAGPQLVELSQLNRFAKEVHTRIDTVAEIIGERISGLADQVAALESRAGYVGAPTTDDYEPVQSNWEVVAEGGVAFPTGGAHTAEAAADAVLPVPQRGDRVRLEGAKTLAFYSVPDGWYDVAGQNGDAFQIRVPQFGGDWLPYIPNVHEGLKEVKSNGKT